FAPRRPIPYATLWYRPYGTVRSCASRVTSALARRLGQNGACGDRTRRRRRCRSGDRRRRARRHQGQLLLARLSQLVARRLRCCCRPAVGRHVLICRPGALRCAVWQGRVSQDSAVRIRFVGSGDAFGSGGRWQTCIYLSAEGQALLVDCGATSFVALKAQGLGPPAVRAGAVAVTHLLGDHFGGLPFLILDGQFSRRTAPLLVAGPPGTRVRLTEAMETLFPGSSRAHRRFPVQVTELAVDGTPAKLGPATV